MSYGGRLAWALAGSLLAACGGATAPRVGGDGTGAADGGASCTGTSCVAAWVAYLKSEATAPSMELGYSVAVSGDGSLVAVAPGTDGGATAPWAVRLFRRSASGWEPAGVVSPPRPCASAGLVLAFSLDARVLAVGAENEMTAAFARPRGALHVFARDGSDAWHEEAFVPSPNDALDNFAQSVALDAAGDVAVVGAPLALSSGTRTGRAYVLTRATGFRVVQPLDASPAADVDDQFGFAVAISGDGATVAVGAIFDDSDARGVDTTGADTAAQSGATYVFRAAAGGFVQDARIKPSNTVTGQTFGYTLALSSAGDVLAVGARGDPHGGEGVDPLDVLGPAQSGAVYLFARGAGRWMQTHWIKPPHPEDDEELGFALALTPDARVLYAGVIGEDEDLRGVDPPPAGPEADRSGAVLAYVQSGGSWTFAHYLKATNTGAGDELGWSVATSADGRTLVAGAHLEDGDARGVDGDGENDRAEDSGAAYAYTLP